MASPDDRYPLLFAPERWEWAGVDVRFGVTPPEDRLVTNVHVVGFAGDKVVLCRDGRDVWFLPGGTREPDETVAECAARELREEAGAVLLGPLHVIGAHHAVSDRPAPYRPHQPHPEMAWLWCYAEVSVDGLPANPEDGETVLEVRAFDLDEACRRLLTDGPWYPELVTLAAEQRAAGSTPPR